MNRLRANNFSRSQLAIFILAFALIGYLIFRSFALNPNLPGDLNNDNTVNITDMSILLSNYGTSNPTADINSDGTVNVLDLSVLLSHYGQTLSAKPSIPTGLTATPGDGQVTLKWNANPSTDQIDLYQVYVNGANTNLAVTGTSYTVTGLTNGTTYEFRVSAHNSSGYGDWTAAITATPQGATGGGGGPGTGFTGPWRNTSYTVPTVFTKTITTASAFKSLVSVAGSLAAGDVVHVVGPMNLDGCSGCHTDIFKRLSAPASIYFDSNVVFGGDSRTTVGFPSVEINATNIYMYGGQVAGGQANDGIRVGMINTSDTAGPNNVRWWGVKIHGTGGTGILAGGGKNSSGTWVGSNNLDFDAEIYNICQQPQNDPHDVDGTGIHAIYVGNTSSDPPGTIMLNNSKFSIYSHDTSTCVGDAQVGQSVQNSEFWVRVANLPYFDSAHGGWTAARALSPWTGASSPYNDKNIIVHDVEAHNISGPVVATDSLHSGPVTVEYGRAVSTLTWSTAKSYFNSNPFQPNSNIIYQDVK
jgi:hypothetical protein